MLNREAATALYHQGLDPTVERLVALAEETERLRAENQELRDLLGAARAPQPTAPSGATPVYQKPNGRKRKRRPGRKPGHPGAARQRPATIDRTESHPPLAHCPLCNGQLNPEPCAVRARVIAARKVQSERYARLAPGLRIRTNAEPEGGGHR